MGVYHRDALAHSVTGVTAAQEPPPHNGGSPFGVNTSGGMHGP